MPWELRTSIFDRVITQKLNKTYFGKVLAIFGYPRKVLSYSWRLQVVPKIEHDLKWVLHVHYARETTLALFLKGCKSVTDLGKLFWAVLFLETLPYIFQSCFQIFSLWISFFEEFLSVLRWERDLREVTRRVWREDKAEIIRKASL